MRLKALIWFLIFAVLLGFAVAANLDSSGGPARGEPVSAVVTRVDTGANEITVTADGRESALRHRRHSEFAYHVGQRLEAYRFDGEIHETLDGVSNATPLRRAYPWLAIGAAVAFVAMLTYVVGWRRAAGVIRGVESGDPVAVMYLERAPKLGTVDWWWTSPPVHPDSERRRIAAVGVILLLAAAVFVVLGAGVWLMDMMSKPSSDAGASSSSASLGFLVAFVFAAVPQLALGMWCLVFRSHPSRGLIRTLDRMRWALIAIGLIGLCLIAVVSRDMISGGILVMAYGMTGTFLRAVRPLAEAAMPGPVVMRDHRADVEEDVARRARAEAQVASDGWGLDMVRGKRERRMFVRYTLVVIGFAFAIGVLSWIKVTLGGL